MSLLDTFKDPVKAAKDGWHSLTETASHAADLASEVIAKPLEAGKSLLNGTLNTISSVTNIDVSSITGTLKTLGTVLTHPVQSLVAGIASTVLSKDAQTVVKNVSELALLASPLGVASLTLAEVAPNHWLSSDKKISVERVASLKDNKDAIELDGLWDVYDSRNEVKSKGAKQSVDRTASKSSEPSGEVLDFSPDIYKSESQKAAKSHEYTNASGEEAKVEVSPGQIKYEASKDGKVVTQATQTADRSVLTHEGETATLETKAGRLTFTGEQVKVLQESNHAEIKLPGGRKVIKANGQIQIIDGKGVLLETIEPNKIVIGTAVRMYGKGTNLDGKADQQQAESTEPGAINVLVTTDGDALALLPDGSRVQLRKDGNALMKLANGQVVLVEASGRLLMLKDNQFVPMEGAAAHIAKAALKQGGLDIEQGQIQFQDGRIDLNRKLIEFRNCHSGKMQRVHVRSSQTFGTPAGVTVHTDTATVVAEGKKVTTTDNQGNEYTTDIEKGDVATPEVKVTQEEIRVRHDDKRPDTIIKADNEVDFEEGKGPILRKNGSMKLDDQTETDADGNVRSGSWHASSNASSGDASVATQFQGRAIGAAQSANDHAANVRGKALSGHVTYSDISALNNDLGNVTMLINQLAAAGCSDYIPALQNSCSALIETLNFALPNVKAA